MQWQLNNLNGWRGGGEELEWEIAERPESWNLELLQLKLLPVSVYGVEQFLLLDQLDGLALGNDSIAAVMEVTESLVEIIKELVLSHGSRDHR